MDVNSFPCACFLQLADSDRLRASLMKDRYVIEVLDEPVFELMFGFAIPSTINTGSSIADLSAQTRT